MITFSTFDLPFLAVTAAQPVPPDFDNMEAYVLTTELNGSQGGTGPWALTYAYADRTLLSLLNTYDNMEEYTIGNDVNGLNGLSFNGTYGGSNYGGTWGAGYTDNYPYFGLGASDSMESYAVGAYVAGLNGGTQWHNFWGTAYTSNDFWVADSMESYVVGTALNGSNSGSISLPFWGGPYTDG